MEVKEWGKVDVKRCRRGEKVGVETLNLRDMEMEGWRSERQALKSNCG